MGLLGLFSRRRARRARSPRHRVTRHRLARLEPLEHRLLMDVGAGELADDFFQVNQNGVALSLDVLANDLFGDGYTGEQRITSVSYGSEGGRIEIADDGRAIRYAPPADFFGTEMFVYYVDNLFSATVTVTIPSPLAFDQYEFLPDGQPRVLDVLANDPFWPGYDGPREITFISETRLGSEVGIAADGKSLVYTPPRDAHGKDAFVYIVDDLYPAQVKIEIPDLLRDDDCDVVQKSENNVLDVLANDPFWPAYPGARTITFVTQPESGASLTITGDGKSLLYTPPADFVGWDHFVYIVDGLYEASASVQVHRPVQDDWFEVDMNSTNYPLMVTVNDRFEIRPGSWRDVVDRVTWVGETAHAGTVEITADGQGILYSAPADFEGRDTFEYVADGKYPAMVTVHVTRPVRDDYFGDSPLYMESNSFVEGFSGISPPFLRIERSGPGVYEDTVNNVLNVLWNDFKGNGYQGPKIITSVSETSEGGIVTIEAGRRLVYTPPPGFRGTDTLGYTVDGEFEASVSVQVGSIVERDYYYYDPDPSKTEYVLDVLDNDHFGGHYPGPGVITAVSETANGGSVTISENGRFIRFVPAEGGKDRFTYTVDGKYDAPVSVSFRNFLASDSLVVDQNSADNELTPLANDFRSRYAWRYRGPRQLTSVGDSEHGGTVTVAADGQTFLYSPPPDFFGTDRFTYTVDGLMRATVTVHVIRRVRNDAFRVEANSHDNALPVLVNDLFGANYSGAGRLTAVTETSAGGTATVGEDGQSIDYTPPADYTGQDKFTYTVDGTLKAEVVVWVGTSVEDVLPRFDSRTKLEQALLDDALERYQHLFGLVQERHTVYGQYDGVLGTIVHIESAGSAAVYGEASSRSHSETNVQVDGVDEGDIIETDGDYLYILTGGELIIADAWPAEEMSIASRVTIEGSPIAEYLNGDRLTVISRTWESRTDGQPPGVNWWYPRWRGNEKTFVTVYDVSDRESPAIVEQTKLDGSYVESRRIDGSVFLVLRNNQVDWRLPGPTREDLGDSYAYETREQYIERMKAEMDGFLESKLPDYASYDADGELVGEGLLHAPEDIFQPLSPDARSLVSVVSLNMNDDTVGITASTGIFTTGASKIYGSLDNLYVFDQQRTWEDGTVTQVLKFGWNAETGGVELAAQGQVAGHMLNQFSADEYDGHLRIATTINNWSSGNWSGRSENVLFVLRDDGGVLEFVGGMQNLALGERIRSVRFLGERAFVTTFRSIDPLFALDLSDPAHPQSRGHITMPGYNSYMQLIDENHILTVGRNTPAGNSGPTQVSLFDVTDLSRPRLIDQYTFERFSTSEAEADHHAFGWFAEHQVLAMPSARVYWERVDGNGDGYRETRRLVQEDELFIFKIDVTATRRSDGGIQLLGEIEHDSRVRRSAFIEDVLYSVATDSVQAVSIVDPTARFAQIEFHGVEEKGSEPFSPADGSVNSSAGAEVPAQVDTGGQAVNPTRPFRTRRPYAESGSGGADTVFPYDSTNNYPFGARDADTPEDDWAVLRDAADEIFALWAGSFDDNGVDSGTEDDDTWGIGPILDFNLQWIGTWEN